MFSYSIPQMLLDQLRSSAEQTRSCSSAGQVALGRTLIIRHARAEQALTGCVVDRQACLFGHTSRAPRPRAIPRARAKARGRAFRRGRADPLSFGGRPGR
jgi:hypothetical protein